MQIHVARDGKELGVYSLEEVNRQLAAGTLRLTDQAWYEGAAGWAALSTVPGVSVAPAIAPAPAPVSPAPVPATATTAAVVVPQRKTRQLPVLSLIFSIPGFCGCFCGFFLWPGLGRNVFGAPPLCRK